MNYDDHPPPKLFQGVTISSTFTDLKEHRAALIKAINVYGLTDVAMENDYAKHMDVIDSSLQMVRDGSAYIGIISGRYGQIPKCPDRNPLGLSITELEFNLLFEAIGGNGKSMLTWEWTTNYATNVRNDRAGRFWYSFYERGAIMADPCAAIRPEDDDLLRSLASAAPSRVLVSSRLVPRVLVNAAGQSIPGVQRISLPGLRPADAEALLRSCGVTGSSARIQNYLTGNCDCHPLVIGVLAGLINDYLRDKGNFDAWAADQTGGRQLNLANLDLIQKRNHILKAGLDALPEKSRQLLSTLALLSEAVDYPTLRAFNPYLPPEHDEMEEPEGPQRSL
jgi:hypothetical protein